MKDDELFSEFSKDFKALCEDPQPLHLELSKQQAWILMSQLQLALRHPQNTGPTSKSARELAETIEAALTATPALKEVARRGWHQEYDLT